MHDWLRPLSVSIVPGLGATPLLDAVLDGVREALIARGHRTQEMPDDTTDTLLCTAPFGEPISWRHSMLFTARRRFHIHHSPTVITLVHAGSTEFDDHLDRLTRALESPEPAPDSYAFPGLNDAAFRVLHEQGMRGGPLLALARLVQAQTKSVRVILIAGEDLASATAYHFDLAGSYATTDGSNPGFLDDLAMRIATVSCTTEITDHIATDGIPIDTWESLTTPGAMETASEQLGRQQFFTDPVVISDLVTVPMASDAVAGQYSEGCFATWEPALDGLISTVTGSARPIHKGRVTEADLSVIVGVRSDRKGTIFRPIDGREAARPSSEAVEMIAMDLELPRLCIDSGDNVPVIRSKLHGHRGVRAFDPLRIEFVPLGPAYYDYPVSCASDAQARAVVDAFSRSESLTNPSDPRMIAFTVLPGHGLIAVEKWVADKEPFQILWEAIDAGVLEISPAVPQGRMDYVDSGDDRLILSEADRSR